MDYDLTFLHTSPVHVTTFGNLVNESGSDFRVRHVIEESFLVHVQEKGADEELIKLVGKCLNSLSISSRVIVVTCSSIGDIAESLNGINNCEIQRIDRAMADVAVTIGSNILVIAALESTLEPTRKLLESSSQRAGTKVDFSLMSIPDAWQHFVSGNMPSYFSSVTKVLENEQNNFDGVVLAQASMAGLASLVELDIPLLSSPQLGVELVIKTLNSKT